MFPDRSHSDLISEIPDGNIQHSHIPQNLEQYICLCLNLCHIQSGCVMIYTLLIWPRRLNTYNCRRLCRYNDLFCLLFCLCRIFCKWNCRHGDWHIQYLLNRIIQMKSHYLGKLVNGFHIVFRTNDHRFRSKCLNETSC